MPRTSLDRFVVVELGRIVVTLLMTMLMMAMAMARQFGVGFYSTFMVSDNVKVYSRSATPGSPGYIWTSKGFVAWCLCSRLRLMLL